MLRHSDHRLRPHPLLLRHPLLHMFASLILACIFVAAGHFFFGFRYTTLLPSPNSPSEVEDWDHRASTLPTLNSRSEVDDWDHRVLASALPSNSTHLSVLVTGAAGFIGTHLSLSLRLRGDGVLGLDSFDSSRYSPYLKRARHSRLSKVGVVVVEGNLDDSALLNRLFSLVPFTHVVHLADSPSFPDDIAALVTLLEAAKSAHPPPSFVWASSSAVYGLNPTDAPSRESDPTDRPATFAAAAKKSGEEITHSYNHIYGLSITALRLSIVYGPWGRPDHSYFEFTHRILHHRPFTVPNISANWAYIDDIVNATLAAIDTAGRSTGGIDGKKQGPAPMRVFNIGFSSLVHVSEVIESLEGLLETKAEWKMVERKMHRIEDKTPADITLARRELGYHPTTDLKTGLKKFINWYAEYSSRPFR